MAFKLSSDQIDALATTIAWQRDEIEKFISNPENMKGFEAWREQQREEGIVWNQ